MTRRYLTVALTLVAAVALLPGVIAAQTQTGTTSDWTPPHTPWGEPDLQGTWSNDVSTPLERPGRFAGKRDADPGRTGEVYRGAAAVTRES